MTADNVPTVETNGGTIRLGQFLKLSGLAESGALARELIVGGDVTVDGEVETQRGRQLTEGMLVEVILPGNSLAARVG
ncbi:MAG: RNA-binding S4 domain-containing protein [Aeromicrobium sp.]